MNKYRRLLEEVRALFPNAKEVTLNIVTTEDERVHFAGQITQHCKELGLGEVFLEGKKGTIDSRVIFGRTGEINVKS